MRFCWVGCIICRTRGITRKIFLSRHAARSGDNLLHAYCILPYYREGHYCMRPINSTRDINI